MQQDATAELTSRQRQVLALVAQGRSNREIAGELGITEQGVKSHVSRLLLRHGVTNRTALVATTKSWSSGADAAAYDAMHAAVGTVRTAVAVHDEAGTPGGSAADRLRTELGVETLRRHAATLSPDAPAEIGVALERLRDIVRELNVAVEFARDLPAGDSSKALAKAVRKRAAEAKKQVDLLEGAISAARR